MSKNKQNEKTETKLGVEFAKSSAGLIWTLATEFPDCVDEFASELNAICGTEEKKSVTEILKASLDKIAPKPDLKAVK